MPVRRPAALAAFLALALVVTACGGGGGTPAPASGGTSPSASGAASPSAGGGESPSASAAGNADISGTLLVGAKYGCKPIPCTPSGEGAADEIAVTRYDVFANAYPDVALEFTEADFNAQTFLTAVAAGNPPDVVRMDRNLVGTYVAEGALDPIDSCIQTFGIDMTQYREAAVAQVTIDGKVYAIPEFYDSRIILVNDSVVEESGLTTADIDTTDWDKFRTVTEKMTKKDGDTLTRMGFDPKLPEFLPLWAKANGADIISADGKTSQLEDPKVAEALTYAVSLITLQADAPAFTDFKLNSPSGKDFFGPGNYFAADTLGAFPMEQWYLNVLADVSPEEGISFVPFKDRQGNNISLSGGSAWVIPATAKNKDAACEFMRTITLPDSWYAAAKVRADKRKTDGEPFTGTYTGNKLADDRIFGELVTEESAGAYYDGVQLVLETSDVAFSMPPNPAAEAFERIWRGAVERVMNEGVDATQALQQADQEAQDAIDKAS